MLRTKLRQKITRLPELPGIYIFKRDSVPIYVGKAKNIKGRIASYLTPILPKTSQMVETSDAIETIVVNTELESLLLEARLIHDHQPKYNSAVKDDKSPLYIKITKDEYPRVVLARKGQEVASRAFFGPFPNSTIAKSTLRQIRKIFAFSDHKIGGRACLLSQIGLCKPCPNEIVKIKNEKVKIEAKKKYLKNIKNIKAVLSGKFGAVRRAMEEEMNELSSLEKYEAASEAAQRLSNLDYITQPITPATEFIENPNLTEDIRNQELTDLKNVLNDKCQMINVKLHRVECFDVAHLDGTHPTASMVTFVEGIPQKSLYRHFKITGAKKANDVASLSEVAKRRLSHLADWGLPDLIVVDGGVSQVSAFEKVFNKRVAVIGIAKNPDRLIVLLDGSPVKLRLPPGPAKNLIIRVRDEAHRFARRLHHKLVTKALLSGV